MHNIVEWEAARSGAGITVAMTDAGGVRRKVHVKKIEARGGKIVAIGGDGARFVLEQGAQDAPAETDFKARCGVCDRVWTVATLPMPLADFIGHAEGARCPGGCIGKVLTA